MRGVSKIQLLNTIQERERETFFLEHKFFAEHFSYNHVALNNFTVHLNSRKGWGVKDYKMITRLHVALRWNGKKG